MDFPPEERSIGFRAARSSAGVLRLAGQGPSHFQVIRIPICLSNETTLSDAAGSDSLLLLLLLRTTVEATRTDVRAKRCPGRASGQVRACSAHSIFRLKPAYPVRTATQ
ncbi:hypothetical protein [Burkholderia alba]|uniref:hypothetical protein n=1 Tax=Burkholderia alba TaxID=2683677 RepID=UPI002B05263D|nr:hypothetical protein [Burkholderia alba]